MENEYTSTTELARKYGHTPSTVISYLKRRGFKSTDIVINSHHMKGWTPEAVECFERHEKSLRSTKLTFAEYVAVLNTDMNTFLQALQDLHITAQNSTNRNPELDTRVREIMKENQINIDKSEHPLVTDENCFRLAYWPDTVPKCFEDL